MLATRSGPAVARAAYRQLQQHGVDVMLDFVNAPRNLAGEGGLLGVDVFVRNHISVRDAVSTLVHEARHVHGFARRLNQNTQWAEWQARARESLLQGRRPWYRVHPGLHCPNQKCKFTVTFSLVRKGGEGLRPEWVER